MPKRNRSTRRLKQLPVKTDVVAPGDVVGGLVYIMDKPSGIEDGMIGFGVDSPEYRKAAKATIKELIRRGKPRSLTARLRQIQTMSFSRDGREVSFDQLTEDEKLDVILRDQEHVKLRYPFRREDVGHFFAGRLHKIKSFRDYYVNIGLGGFIFRTYQNYCKVNPNDPPVKQIAGYLKTTNAAGESISRDNEVYMVKQDSYMTAGRTSPSVDKILATSSVQAVQRALLYPATVVLTAGLSVVALGAYLGIRKLGYLFRNSTDRGNLSAITETICTKVADLRGLPSQDIDVIDGTYPNGAPKKVMLVEWDPDLQSMEDQLAGGAETWDNSLIYLDENSHPIRIDEQGRLYRVRIVSEKDAENRDVKRLVYEREGTHELTEVSKAEYEAARLISDGRYNNLGESLLLMLAMGDRDALGKKAQNKGAKYHRSRRQLFGIDFGKSFEGDNPTINSLKDDFSFKGPTSAQTKFVNYSVLYDNPLREKMKGLYLLQALRGQLPADLKAIIVEEYREAGDEEFAAKLENYPKSLATKESETGVDADILLIRAEEFRYRGMAEKTNDPQQKREYLLYANHLQTLIERMRKTEAKIFEVFAARRYLTPKQIDVLDNLEKLTSGSVSTSSPDGKVQLNHIQVARKARVTWQLQSNPDGTFCLVAKVKKFQSAAMVQQHLKAMNNPEFLKQILQRAQVNGKKLTIDKLTSQDLEDMQLFLTEDCVALARGLPYTPVLIQDNLSFLPRRPDAAEDIKLREPSVMTTLAANKAKREADLMNELARLEQELEDEQHAKEAAINRQKMLVQENLELEAEYEALGQQKDLDAEDIQEAEHIRRSKAKKRAAAAAALLAMEDDDQDDTHSIRSVAETDDTSSILSIDDMDDDSEDTLVSVNEYDEYDDSEDSQSLNDEYLTDDDLESELDGSLSDTESVHSSLSSIATAVSHHQERSAHRPVMVGLGLPPNRQAADSDVESVFEQAAQSVAELHEYLTANKDRLSKKHGLTHFTDPNKTDPEKITLTFDNPIRKKAPIQVVAQNNNNNGLKVKAKKNLSDDEFKLTAQKLAHVLVGAAKNDATFTISKKLSPERQEMLAAAITQAIDSISKKEPNKWTEENLPSVKFEDNSNLSHTYRNHPRSAG